jgi:nucleoside-diphosphate-sugar epimerase
LTNVYGPRQLIKHNRQGFIGWFIRLAVENQTIQIYGDGSQLRDFVYVDDAADAFLRAGASDACNGEVFNVGGDRPISPPRADDAARRPRRFGCGALRRVAVGAERRSTSAASTPTRASSGASTGWTPKVSLGDGLARTVAFYREHLHHYVEPAEGAASA